MKSYKAPQESCGLRLGKGERQGFEGEEGRPTTVEPRRRRIRVSTRKRRTGKKKSTPTTNQGKKGRTQKTACDVHKKAIKHSTAYKNRSPPEQKGRITREEKEPPKRA